MGEENGGPPRLWPCEDEVVPLTPPSIAVVDRVGYEGGLETRDSLFPTGSGLSAEEFTPERMMRPAGEPSAGGWRRMVYVLSAGLVAPGPGRMELRRRELV